MANGQPKQRMPDGDDEFSEAINSVFSNLPHARELAGLNVSGDFSSFAGCSGNVMPFRDNALTSEEREDFLAMLDALDTGDGQN